MRYALSPAPNSALLLRVRMHARIYVCCVVMHARVHVLCAQYRSIAHKPVAAQIALLALLGHCCTISPIQAVLGATLSISLLGHPGSNMYIDRLVEYINKLQQGAKKSAHAASFGRSMDMTTLLPALLHVRHAFAAHETGEPAGSDPVTLSMLVSARLLQNEFVRLLGRDLTVHTTHNVFWHTGTPVPRDTGDYRVRRPSEWIWRVASGAAAGKGRARREAWLAFSRRMVNEHFFPY